MLLQMLQVLVARFEFLWVAEVKWRIDYTGATLCQDVIQCRIQNVTLLDMFMY
jgi:hypothetical protein